MPDFGGCGKIPKAAIGSQRRGAAGNGLQGLCYFPRRSRGGHPDSSVSLRCTPCLLNLPDRMSALRFAAKILYRLVPQDFRRLLFLGSARFCPLCESRVRRFYPAGLDRRPDARCPVCGSLERHRLFRIVAEKRTDLFDERARRVLHIAPEGAIERLVRRLPGVRYLSADLEDPRAMVRMDITDIGYPDGSFDVLLCSHVLEHVPDDRKALREFYRVLSPGGWGMIRSRSRIRRLPTRRNGCGCSGSGTMCAVTGRMCACVWKRRGLRWRRSPPKARRRRRRLSAWG